MDRTGSVVIIVSDEYFLPEFEIKKMGLSESEFKEVFETLKQYIQNNPQQFEIGKLVAEKANWSSGVKDEEGYDWMPENPKKPLTLVTPIEIATAGRPWWSPIFTANCRRKSAEGSGRVKLPNGQIIEKIFIGNLRRIEHRGQSRNKLEPSAFTAEQFEELKNLVPGHCRIKGCYNNYSFFNETYPDPWGQEGHEVTGDICSFHRVYPDYHYDIMEELGSNTNPQPDQQNNNIPDNTTIQQYNDWVDQKLREFQNAYMNLQEDCDLKEGLLMSLGKEELPEVRAQINIVFQPYETLKYKELLTGGVDDPNVQARNLTIETSNTWVIQKWENEDLTKKQAAVNELQKILDRVNNSDNTKDPEPDNQGNQSNLSDLSAYRQKVINSIKTALNQEPKLTNSDLSNSNWEDLINATDDKTKIDNIKNQLFLDITVKRKAKKEGENIANNLETEGKDAEQLKKQLEEVEKAQGQQSYEDNQAGIDNLKNELAEKVSEEEYNQIITNTVNNSMIKYNIKEDELDLETKKNWQKLKNREIKDKDQVNKMEKLITKKVGEEGSKKKLSKILQEAQQSLKLDDKNKIKAVRNKLYSFLVSTDIYEKSLFSQREKEIQKVLKDLENHSSQKQTHSDKFPWKVVVPVILTLLTLTLGVIIYRKRKKRLNS